MVRIDANNLQIINKLYILYRRVIQSYRNSVVESLRVPMLLNRYADCMTVYLDVVVGVKVISGWRVMCVGQTVNRIFLTFRNLSRIFPMLDIANCIKVNTSESEMISRKSLKGSRDRFTPYRNHFWYI